MPKHINTFQEDWKVLDQMALGLIYGAILVQSALMSLEENAETPYRPAIVLFGSILAVTLAKGFSELLAHGIHTHQRVMTGKALAHAWSVSYPTLLVANVPTVLILASVFGWIDFATAVLASQVFCVAILVVFGARVGWAINPKSWLPVFGAVFAGGLGSALAALKYTFH